MSYNYEGSSVDEVRQLAVEHAVEVARLQATVTELRGQVRRANDAEAEALAHAARNAERAGRLAQELKAGQPETEREWAARRYPETVAVKETRLMTASAEAWGK